MTALNTSSVSARQQHNSAIIITKNMINMLLLAKAPTHHQIHETWTTTTNVSMILHVCLSVDVPVPRKMAECNL